MSKRSVSARQLEVFYARLTHQSLESIETEAFAQWLVESEQLGFLQGIQKYKKTTTRGGVEYYNQYKCKLFELESDYDITACFESFHQRMQGGVSYYLKHPLEFDEDITYLERLSLKLAQIEKDLLKPYTINQRSFQIFQNEKLISGKGLKATAEDLRWQSILKRLNLTGSSDSLNYVELKQFPQTLEINRKEGPGVVLILENQDPMLTVIEVLLRHYPPNESPIDAIVLGSGNSCESLFYYLYHDFFKGVLGHPDTTYYYAGDLDAEGLKIFNRLTKRYPDRAIQYLPDYFKWLLQTLGCSDWRQTTQQKPQAEDLGWMMEILRSQGLDNESIQGVLIRLKEKKMVPQEVMTAESWKAYLSQLTF